MKKSNFQKLVNSCKNIGQVAKKLNVSNSKARKMMISDKIDYSHFSRRGVYDKMVNKKFNMLKVVSIEYKKNEYAGRVNNRALANCVCDCGKLKTIRCDAIKDGTRFSCGCHSHNRWNTVGSKNHSFSGVGKLGSVKFNEIKKCAIRRNISFKITIREAWNVFKRQNGKCALTGMPMWFGRTRIRHETNASLDRIDSSQGYTKNNIEWVLKDINRIKGSFNKEYFINLCNLVAIHHPRKKLPK